jgi:large subunit ribosomal protein L24
MKVAKNDTVIVISGEDRGKTGRVLKVFPEKSRVIVEKVNFVKRHTRARKQGVQGGILEKEAPVHVSNVQLYCPKCQAGTRIRRSRLADGTPERACVRCGEMLARPEPRE